MTKQSKDIASTGMSFFRGKVSESWIEDLRKESEISFKKHYEIQVKNKVEKPNRWLALNAIGDCNLYLKFAESLILEPEVEKFLTDYFEGSFILNSFSMLNAKRDDNNFSSKHHRDSKYFMNGMNLMINFLVFIDDGHFPWLWLVLHFSPCSASSSCLVREPSSLLFAHFLSWMVVFLTWCFPE